MNTPIETARASLLKIWPDGANCQHSHAREAFAALDAAQEQVAALPADWSTDSSLETWFPFSAQELVNLREEVKTYSLGMQQMDTERDAAIAERDRLRDIIMVICERLEIGRCEDGPCDDVSKYTSEIDALINDERTKAAIARAETAKRRIAQLAGLLRKIKEHSSRVKADGDFYAAFNWRYLDEITAALSESGV